MSEPWRAYSTQGALLIPGNHVEILYDGKEAFPAMLDAIEGAREAVCLETYIFEPDGIGTRFRDVLRAAAQRGVQVRVICDAIGSFDADDGFWAPLRDSGGEVLVFHPIAPWRKRWPERLNRRDHRKLLVVDGDVGFCGGINIHDEELPESQDGAGWRDTHLRVRGPAVRELIRIFLSTWRRELGKAPVGEHLLSDSEPAGEMTVRVVATDALRQRRAIRQAYLHAISRSRRFIYLWNPYFVPDRGVRRALRNARRRRVEIKVIVPARSDILAVQFASRRLYSRLMRTGIQIFEWREHVMHAKAGVIDALWSTVGSYNLDHRSFLHNSELNVMVLGEEFGRAMVEMFESDLESCAQVDPAAWRFRPLLDRFFERFFYLFRYWL